MFLRVILRNNIILRNGTHFKYNFNAIRCYSPRHSEVHVHSDKGRDGVVVGKMELFERIPCV